MTGYTKLFASILHSTIWRESDKTRIVWITMLAMADQWGDVQASVPGLADAARVSLEEVEEALEKLKAPDPYSRTKDHEGRRIKETDGGWSILNHAKYREKMTEDQRREYFRIKQQERRERLKGQTPVKQCQTMSKPVTVGSGQSTLSTQAEADSDSKADTKAMVPPPSPRVGISSPYSAEFEEFWTAYPKKKSKADALTAYKKLKGTPNNATLIVAIRRQLASDPQWRKDGGQFIPHPASWLNSHGWEDETELPLSNKSSVEDWNNYKPGSK